MHLQASLSVTAEETATTTGVSFQVLRGPGTFGTIGVTWEVSM